MMKIALPARPVDRYEVRFWELSGYDYAVRERLYVYHVHTKWEDFAERVHDRGAPIIDDWMCYESVRTDGSAGNCVGRIPGWAAFDGKEWVNRWAMRSEALEASHERISKRLLSLESEVRHYLRMKLDIAKELTRDELKEKS